MDLTVDADVLDEGRISSRRLFAVCEYYLPGLAVCQRTPMRYWGSMTAVVD